MLCHVRHFFGIVTPSGDIGNVQDWIEDFGHLRVCCSDPFSCSHVRRIRARMREYDPFLRCATGLCRTQHDTVRHTMTRFSVASGIHAAVFDARSPRSDVGQRAPDLRDSVVQAQDIHKANSSLKTLQLNNNQISDEGAIALAQALQATLVVSANCSCDRGRGTVGHHPTLCQLHHVFLCHMKN